MRAAVLFVSPHLDDARRLSEMLSSWLDLDQVAGLRQARAQLVERRYHVIVTAGVLLDGSWRDVLELAREMAPGTEVILTDPVADASLWAEALNLGAYDLLVQPFDEAEVRRILSNACSRGAPQMSARPVL